MIITIGICTWNRYDYIVKCLDSILAFDTDLLEVIVIDSNSTDGTAKIPGLYQNQFNSFTYYRLLETGLSKARNKCIELSKGDWICFVDDDTILPSNLILEIRRTIENYSFDCFGGSNIVPADQIVPLWLPRSYVERKLPFKEPTVLIGKEIPGLFMVIKKDVFNIIGGFTLALGYNGKKKINGEDTEFQIRMRRNGYKIGYNPNIIIQHYVHDTTFLKLLKSVYRTGRDSRYFSASNWLDEFYIFIRVLCSRVLKTPYYFIRPLILKNDHFKTSMFDYLTPLVRACGRLEGKWKISRKLGHAS